MNEHASGFPAGTAVRSSDGGLTNSKVQMLIDERAMLTLERGAMNEELRATTYECRKNDQQ